LPISKEVCFFAVKATLNSCQYGTLSSHLAKQGSFNHKGNILPGKKGFRFVCNVEATCPAVTYSPPYKEKHFFGRRLYFYEKNKFN